MDKHYGQIVEHCVRRNEYNISDLAKCIKINRRSVYNWFKQKNLKSDIIFRIGCVINHDFSVEFPELFTSDDFKTVHQPNLPSIHLDNKAEEIWKTKYIALLEKYNKALSANSISNALKTSVNMCAGVFIIPHFCYKQIFSMAGDLLCYLNITL